jgi:hypothetical protein
MPELDPVSSALLPAIERLLFQVLLTFSAVSEELPTTKMATTRQTTGDMLYFFCRRRLLIVRMHTQEIFAFQQMCKICLQR